MPRTTLLLQILAALVTTLVTTGAQAAPLVAKSVASGRHHSCAVTTAGGVVCWGLGTKGQIGNGQKAAWATAQPVTGLASGVLDVTAGGNHSCALLESGDVRCWGANSNGQLGVGGPAATTPKAVPGLTEAVTALVAGDSHTCALLASGSVTCWGSQSSGQLGTGQSGFQNGVPGTLVSDLPPAKQIAAGLAHTCVVTQAGDLYCWGSGSRGQLGTGASDTHKTPVKITLPAEATSLSAFDETTCAVLTGGMLRCFGSTIWGQIGSRQSQQILLPKKVHAQLESGVSTVGVGRGHVCVLKSGSVHCLGDRIASQLGEDEPELWFVPSTFYSQWSAQGLETPRAVAGLPAQIVQLAPGHKHTCARAESGRVHCWGYGLTGELGGGAVTISGTPFEVQGP